MDNMTFFHEGTVRICGSLDIDKALKDLYAFLKHHLPLEWIELGFFDPEMGALVSISRHTDLKLGQQVQEPITLSEEAIRFARNRNKGIFKIDSSADDIFAQEIFKALGISSVEVFFMPLRMSKKRLGGVAVMARLPKQFTPMHGRLLRLLHDPIAVAMSNHLRYREVLHLKELLADDNQYLRKELHRITGNKIIGENYGLRDVMKMVNQVAPLDSNVLLQGETGAGKEVIANALHYLSPRRNGPLIKVNCGAIPEGLLDSELFGHEKGAFTGAAGPRRGRFELAHTGTIFLDEVGELPPQAQIRFLRVLQDRRIDRVGGGKPVSVDVRVIAATNRDLGRMVGEGKFREDLWYRLNVVPIHIPPLRRRKEDIPAFVSYFIDKKIQELNIPYRPVLAPDAISRLQDYPWPGNVRELENIVERELIQNQAATPGAPLRFTDITHRDLLLDASSDISAETPAKDLSLDHAMRAHIKGVLKKAHGKIQGEHGAAALLGINASTLRHRMRKLGIDFGRNRA